MATTSEQIKKMSEQINQAKELLENEGYQVYNCASIDLMGAFNYHTKQVRELLADKKRQQEEIERLQALGQEHCQNTCDTICQIAHKNYDKTRRLREENEELKRKVLLQQEAGYYCHTRPAPDCDINTDDASFDHYWSVQDNDLTLWKVPRHLADVPSAQTSYHGAVEQAFYDECFGEEYGKLKWMRVREMKQADLIKGGWKPKVEEEEEVK